MTGIGAGKGAVCTNDCWLGCRVAAWLRSCCGAASAEIRAPARRQGGATPATPEQHHMYCHGDINNNFRIIAAVESVVDRLKDCIKLIGSAACW